MVRRQRKSRKREGKKFNQKKTHNRHLPLLLKCRSGEDDYRDNGPKILTNIPKRFPFMLEDNKNCNAYCKIFTNFLGCLVFPLKMGMEHNQNYKKKINVNNRCLLLYICCDCSLKNNAVAIPKRPIGRQPVTYYHPSFSYFDTEHIQLLNFMNHE